MAEEGRTSHVALSMSLLPNNNGIAPHSFHIGRVVCKLDAMTDIPCRWPNHIFVS